MAFVINTVTLSGTLVRDPETRAIPNSSDLILNMRIAVNARRKNGAGEYEDVPQFFNVSTFSAAQWLSQNLAKGMNVAVSGELRWREYQDKDGNRREAIEVLARDVVPIPKRDAQGGGGQPRSGGLDDFGPASPPVRTQPPAPVPVAAAQPVEDNLPF